MEKLVEIAEKLVNYLLMRRNSQKSKSPLKSNYSGKNKFSKRKIEHTEEEDLKEMSEGRKVTYLSQQPQSLQYGRLRPH